MNQKRVRKTGDSQPQSPSRPVIDAADWSGAWGILAIKKELGRREGIARAEVINIDPAILEDLIQVLTATGYRVSDVTTEADHGRLVIGPQPDPDER